MLRMLVGSDMWINDRHLARLGRKSLSFSKSVELHDKVIGHYLNIKHYQ
ncbi:transposase [Shigella sonnei]|nr:transposase [Shigella sonnei]